ncbi:PREDICTED: keratin-associated protein 5-4-like, partial [Eurypyga helias]
MSWCRPKFCCTYTSHCTLKSRCKCCCTLTSCCRCYCTPTSRCRSCCTL